MAQTKLGCRGGVLCGRCFSRSFCQQTEGFPDFNPDGLTGWSIDRPAADDFLPPESGPGPVLADPKHPYVPNGQGQSTYRIADLGNPILKPWAIEQMKKTNDEVLVRQGAIHCARTLLARRSAGNGYL